MEPLLVRAVTLLNQCALLTLDGDGSPGTGRLIADKMAEFFELSKQLDGLRASYPQQVPARLLELLDQGLGPDQYVQQSQQAIRATQEGEQRQRQALQTLYQLLHGAMHGGSTAS